LHLIKQHELDVLDLPISFVTEKYLKYIEVMKELDLDVASEYLVMAAELARIKSRMLLPPSPDQDQDDEEEEMDPRAELIRRLLEYQKYKKVADELGERDLRGRDIFVREVTPPELDGPAPLREFSAFKLLEAFHAILARADKEVALEISAERITIQARMSQVTGMLRAKKRCSFEALFEDVKTTYEIVVTFLAILEMTKMRITRLYQAESSGPLHIEYRVTDDSPEDDSLEHDSLEDDSPEDDSLEDDSLEDDSLEDDSLEDDSASVDSTVSEGDEEDEAEAAAEDGETDER
jgi:segregation and condensation protein A